MTQTDLTIWIKFLSVSIVVDYQTKRRDRFWSRLCPAVDATRVLSENFQVVLDL